MKIAVLGCGAIGGLFLGYLTRQGMEVTGIVKDYQKEAFDKEGLLIEGVEGKHCLQVSTDTSLKQAVDLAILSTKIDDVREVIAANREFLREANILTTQNGVRADYIINEYVAAERIITGIVMFGATFYPPNRVVHNFPGNLVLGNIFSLKSGGFQEARKALEGAFTISELENIKGAKYLKVFINLNNCIPALLGGSMQEVFSDIDCAKLAIRINREAFGVIKACGISLESLPGYPKERIQGLVTMPTDEAASIFSKIMTGLSKEPLYGSILQSIKRGRRSEIDYINGEITQLARANNTSAPLNEKIVDLVHRIEDSKIFLSKAELLAEIKGVPVP
jgi:2-dehydropantoate 2-reductase